MFLKHYFVKYINMYLNHLPYGPLDNRTSYMLNDHAFANEELRDFFANYFDFENIYHKPANNSASLKRKRSYQNLVCNEV